MNPSSIPWDLSIEKLTSIKCGNSSFHTFSLTVLLEKAPFYPYMQNWLQTFDQYNLKALLVVFPTRLDK